VKKDLVIAVIAILVVGGVCYGLAATRPAFAPTAPSPFSTASVGTRVTGRVVIRVNGEPITETEYEAAYRQLPPEMQQQFASEPGKMAFAEQLVRMKLLEQEGRRLGVEQDPKVAGVLAAQRTDVLADAAAEKLVAQPTEEALKKFYAENKDKFETLNISHILIAYAGGSVPPRAGGSAPAQEEAMRKAIAAYGELKNGADFGATARKYSDDVASLRQGGQLGPVARGMLPKELDARVFQIPVGQFSGPIPSRFGIHIFRVNARSTRPFEQVRTVVSQRVRQQNMFDRVEILRRNAKTDFDEKFFPEARKWPSGKKPS
jgi:parvulin-like peptidyl-prolyl isomerase